jgi:hypothetical protein
MIGDGGASTMPSVIAFQRQPGGNVCSFVGDSADGMTDGPDTLVIRNIKRWALTSDPYVQQQLNLRSSELPRWWNPKTRCVSLWNQQIPVSEVIHRIINEAINRAAPGYVDEWRAGCPVHAGLTYRAELAKILSGFGGNVKITGVVEEPILFLVLAYRIGNLKPGSYLVYDFGGGSFDCALAEVKSIGGEVRLTVYAADGDPLLGGADIDHRLAQKLNYEGHLHLLRVAKEGLIPSSMPVRLFGGITLEWSQLEEVLKEGKFLDKTLNIMLGVYRNAKLLWNRGDDAPPVGDVIKRNLVTGAIRFVRELNWEEMKTDLDGVILFGGSTRSPFFQNELAKHVGADKLIFAKDLVPNFPDPELVGLSMGACYLLGESYTPLYVNRLPARVILREIGTDRRVSYEPYDQLTLSYVPNEAYASELLPVEENRSSKYEILVTDAENDVLSLHSGYCSLDRYLGLPAISLRLLIDNFGRVCVEKKSRSGKSRQMDVVIEDPPWQTPTQRIALQIMWDQQREQERIEKVRVYDLLTKNPFGWQA